FNGQVAFVDAGVADSASLVSQFSSGTEIHLLDSSQDAIDQITSILANRSNISAVHLVSHGSDGALLLGGKTVSDLNDYDAELQQWSDSLSSDADILLYGCNVAADGTGKAFVNQLGQLTGADVTASDDLTGSVTLGGDWTLEYSTGAIETAAIADTAYQDTLANFRVTTLNDVVDPNDGVISLREAVNAANTLGGSNNIFFNVNGTITLTGGELGISSNLSIFGNGASFTTISGNRVSAVFFISSGTVLLSGLTVTNGGAGESLGGGIFNSGNLTVQFCTLQGNSAFYGGGIGNRGTLTVNSSTFSGNSAGSGGGIYNDGGTLTVNSSTFSRNKAGSEGGGILNKSGTLTVNSSTFSDNMASVGGGIDNEGTLTVNSSTFSGNQANGFGGGGIINRSTLTVSSSTFSGNRATNGSGGGIVNTSIGTLTVNSSYFLNNQVSNIGGGLYNFGTATLIGNVISQNRATNAGGGVYNDSGTVRLQLNNISSNTAPSGTDLFGAFVSGNSPTNPFGFNVIGKGGGFSGIVNGVNGDVILAPGQELPQP
ncbi:MAG: DUF4347 domain-containing protein, partial [Elainella sp.]